MATTTGGSCGLTFLLRLEAQAADQNPKAPATSQPPSNKLWKGGGGWIGVCFRWWGARDSVKTQYSTKSVTRGPQPRRLPVTDAIHPQPQTHTGQRAPPFPTSPSAGSTQMLGCRMKSGNAMCTMPSWRPWSLATSAHV